ncbi:MAG: hypoxanthine phosphoribosyltransferase [Snowella sp.]|nr:hypoxanthine phosphoribosyltransferase [Snowella sp.]
MEKPLTLLISSEEIANTNKRLAQEIDRDCQGQSLTVVGILKGSFIFIADLVREIQTPIENIEFIQLSSYGSATVSSGQADLLLDVAVESIQGKHILIAEDIVDTGISTTKAINLLQQKGPASLKLCSLLSKPSRRQKEVHIDYLGFSIPDHFVLGYGLDVDQKYRQLPAIYYFKD